jgi:oligopeptidase A
MFISRTASRTAIKASFVSASVLSASFGYQSASFTSSCERLNPLLSKNTLPKFSEIKYSDVKPAVDIDLNSLKSNFKKLEIEIAKNAKSESYPMVVEGLEKVQADLEYSWGIVGHLMGVKNSDELRSAHKEMQQPVIEAFQMIGQSKPLFDALSSLKERQAIWEKLDEAQQRIVTASIKSMESSGVGLTGADKEKFNKLQLEAAELSTKFSNNVLDSTKAFSLKLTDKKDIEGLPASAVSLFVQQAIAAGDKDSTIETGPWLVTLDMPSYLPCMQHLKSREIREKLYRAYVTRASSICANQDNNNEPIVTRILQVKYEMSKMLGYKNYADRSLSTKMAEDVNAVLKLSEMLREKSFPAAQKEFEQLQKFANSEGHKGKLCLWDVPYYSERQREKLYEFSEEELRPYLPFPSVLQGLFNLANRLFNINIVESENNVDVWSQDVKFYKIYDSTSKVHLASFYLDPYSRPAEKRGGAWMASCQGKSKVLGKFPVAYLTCNGSPPVGSDPSLMTFREVETLFHEFGHGLQHMLTTVPHADAAGINNVEWDAVELPSQFMENWCFDKNTLNSFAKHYKTGEKLPVELFDKMVAAKNYHSGMQMLRQLYFGALDMTLYSTFDSNGDISPFKIQNSLAEKYTVLSPLDNDRFLCSFGHIFAGGYSAGYYSYKWAEVLSADAFSLFEEIGLDNDEEIKLAGRKFRNTVLAMGKFRNIFNILYLS